MDRSLYRKPENWYGSYYELAVELQPTGDDERLLRAMQRLWDYPALTGPWTSREAFGHPPAVPATVLQSDPVPLYGVLELDDGREIGCVSHVIREEGGSDWLDLSLPTGMLESVFQVEYPLAEDTNPWLAELDEAFVLIAEWLYAEAPFQVAIIGEEVSGFTSATEMNTDEVASGGFILPRPLWDRLQPGAGYRVRSHDLRFVPPTGPGITWGDPHLRMIEAGREPRFRSTEEE